MPDTCQIVVGFSVAGIRFEGDSPRKPGCEIRCGKPAMATVGDALRVCDRHLRIILRDNDLARFVRDDETAKDQG